MKTAEEQLEEVRAAWTACDGVKAEFLRRKHGIENKMMWLDRFEEQLEQGRRLSVRQERTLDNICRELRGVNILEEGAGGPVEARTEKVASEKLQVALTALRRIYDGEEVRAKELARRALKEMGEPAFVMGKGIRR